MTHNEMLQILWTKPKMIQEALGWESIWVKGKEFHYNRDSQERADMVVHNQYSASEVLPNTICAIIEEKAYGLKYNVNERGKK